MKWLRSILLVAIIGAGATALAQSASWSAKSELLLPQGGTVTLTATLTYAGQPGALGWSIALPDDWKLESITGPNLPQVAPESGTAGTLEFAYTAVPPQGATFAITVVYPPRTNRATARATAIVRANGSVLTLTPDPLEFFQKRKAPREEPKK